MSRRELFIMLVLVAVMLFVGIYPAPLLDIINTGAQGVLQMMGIIAGVGG